MPKKIHRIYIPIHTYAYVRAESKEQALALLKGLVGKALHLEGGMIDADQFEFAKNDINFSPGMTIGEPGTDPFIPDN